MSNKHNHPRKDEMGVFWIPADTDIPMEYKLIENNWRAMSQLIDGYCTLVHSELMPELYCGCRMVMVVDEEGEMKNLTQNLRAQIYYPHPYPVVGDVFLMAEGLVYTADGVDVDLFGLPPELNRWEGPGSPLPPIELVGS
jgi:hypothetical protein